MRMRDLTGKKIGWLTVLNKALLKYVKSGKQRLVMWDCVCDCGKLITVSARYLLRHGGYKTYGEEKDRSPQSCGCQNRVSGQYAAIHTPDGASWAKLLGSYRRNAQDRFIAWCLPDDKALSMFRDHCHYCGAEPRLSLNAYTNCNGEPFRDTGHERISAAGIMYNGIDRMNSNLGYTEDNCVSCCFICNSAKMDMLYEEFLQWIERVRKKWLK